MLIGIEVEGNTMFLLSVTEETTFKQIKRVLQEKIVGYDNYWIKFYIRKDKDLSPAYM